MNSLFSNPVRAVRLIAGMIVFVFLIVYGSQLWSRRPPIEGACIRGDIGAVRSLLDSDPGQLEVRDGDGRTPLLTAIRAGNVEISQLLIDRGANVNAADNYGVTPLHDAAAWARLTLIPVLIARGAKINAADNQGETPLHRAMTSGSISPEDRVALTRLLLSAGADASIRDTQGRTPMEIAVDKERDGIPELLRSFHAGS